MRDHDSDEARFFHSWRYFVSFVRRHTGADERIRTADLLITNQLLYQLSYVGLNLASSDTSVKVVARAEQSILAHGYQLRVYVLIMHFF